MKFSRKLMMVSVAALMGVSPVLGLAANASTTVLAAKTSAVHKTYGRNSRVRVTRTVRMVNRNGKKTNKTARKTGRYIIWDVARINGVLYYSIQTNLKYWIPASATKGSVQYKEGRNTVTLITNGTTKFVKKTTKPAPKKNVKKPAKKASKKGNRKASKKGSKKVTKKTTKKAVKKSTKKAAKAVRIKTIRRTPVVGNNGKKVKTYMGSRKYTIIGKHITVKGFGTKMIKGVKYYALTPNRYYIKASDVKVIK